MSDGSGTDRRKLTFFFAPKARLLAAGGDSQIATGSRPATGEHASGGDTERGMRSPVSPASSRLAGTTAASLSRELSREQVDRVLEHNNISPLYVNQRATDENGHYLYNHAAWVENTKYDRRDALVFNVVHSMVEACDGSENKAAQLYARWLGNNSKNSPAFKSYYQNKARKNSAAWSFGKCQDFEATIHAIDFGVTSISCSETVPNVVQQCGCGCSRAECPTLVMGNHKDC